MVDAVVLYKESTSQEERFAFGFKLAISKAQRKMVKLIWSKNFDKYVTVANPKNNDKFFDEVLLLNPLYYFFHALNFFLLTTHHLIFSSYRSTTTTTSISIST